MTIIKKNNCYDNKYLENFKISLETKELLTILRMRQPDFNDDDFELRKYNNDTPEHIEEVLKELVDNNYLTIAKKSYEGNIKYIIYHNRRKMI